MVFLRADFHAYAVWNIGTKKRSDIGKVVNIVLASCVLIVRTYSDIEYIRSQFLSQLHHYLLIVSPPTSTLI